MRPSFFATFLKGMRGRRFLGEERRFEEEEEEVGREEKRIVGERKIETR